MGRPKRLYPLGKYRLRTPKVIVKEKAYPIELEYTWNRQIIRKTTNVFVKVADWNQNGNQGRHRQVIIVTHNPNIAMLGDAELIIPLKSTSVHSQIISLGSIDNNDTVKLCCSILEGGDSAFKQRKNIYGF